MLPKPPPKQPKRPRVKPVGLDYDVELKKVALIFYKPKPQPPASVWAPGRSVVLDSAPSGA